MNEARKEVLEQLIESKLLEQEIKKKKIEVPERDVDAAVEDVLKQNQITVDELKIVLAKEGMTLTSYRERLRDSMGKMRLVNREIKSKIVIKEEDMRKFYRDNQEVHDPPEVKVQQIFFAIPREAPADRWRPLKEAAEVLEQAKEGGRLHRAGQKLLPGAGRQGGGFSGSLNPRN